MARHNDFAIPAVVETQVPGEVHTLRRRFRRLAMEGLGLAVVVVA